MEGEGEEGEEKKQSSWKQILFYACVGCLQELLLSADSLHSTSSSNSDIIIVPVFQVADQKKETPLNTQQCNTQ
jgi:hypothetical protein